MPVIVSILRKQPKRMHFKCTAVKVFLFFNMFTSIKSFNLSKTVRRCTMGLSHTESNNLNLSKGCILVESDLLPHLHGATETLLMLITQMLLVPKDVCRFSCFFKSRSVFLTITRLASLEFSK